MAETVKTARPDLEKLSRDASQGEWTVERMENEGSSPADKFFSYGIVCGPHTILDTLNSSGGVLEQENHEDGCTVWDEQARRDLTYIAALVNDHRAGRLVPAAAPAVSDGGARILAGLEDALAYAQGDTSQAKLITVKDGQIVDVQDASPGPWRPQLTGADRLGRDRKGDVTINVPTALCWLQFQPDVSTGTEEETRPGVGFTLVAYPGSAGEWPCGVIPRDEAFRLYEMLGRFFAAHPPSGEPAAQELEAAASLAAPVQADRLRRIAAVLRGATVGGPSRG